MRWLTDWWDSVELWVTQLGFPFQVALAIAVLLPVCWVGSAVADRISETLTTWWSTWWSRYRRGAGA